MITVSHTLLCNEHTEQFTTCLIVCPLNTILNWQYEWQKWLDKRDRVPVSLPIYDSFRHVKYHH